MRIITGRQAQATKASARKLKGFGKCYEPGKTLTCFYPVHKNEEGAWDLIVGAIWGHRVNDFKALSGIATFIPTTCEIDQDGVVTSEPDVALQFSRIAAAYIKGEKDKKMAEVLARELPTEAMRAELITKINDEYDAQKNMDAPKPVIGGLTYLITTEVLVVPRSSDSGKPVTQNMELASQTMSDQRMNKLYAILDSDTCVVHTKEDDPDFGMLEVTYQYPAGVSKTVAGQTLPEVVVQEYTIQSRYADCWNEVQRKFAEIAHDSDMVMRRNYSYTKVSQMKLMQCIRNYVVMNGSSLNYLDKSSAEYERLMKNIDVVVRFDAHKHVSNEMKAEFAKALQEYEEEHGEVGNIDTTKEEPANPSIPNVEQLLEQNLSNTEEAVVFEQ